MNYKIYIINLDKDKDRFRFMQEQMNSLGFEYGVNYERVNAIYGAQYLEDCKDGKIKEEDVEYDKNLAIKYHGAELRPGEIGCALSHKRAWQKFKQDSIDNPELKYAIICEDDILIKNKNFKKIIETEIERNDNSFHENKKNIWNYLQFDYWGPVEFWSWVWFRQVYISFIEIKDVNILKHIFLKLIFILKTLFKIPVIIFLSIFEIFRDFFVSGPVTFYRDLYLAGCYMIDHACADKLIGANNKIIYPADKIQVVLKKNNTIKLKQYCPSLIRQQRGVFESNLHKELKELKNLN